MDGVDVRSVGIALQRCQEPSHMAASLLAAVYDEVLRSGLARTGAGVAERCNHWRSDGAIAEVGALQQGGCHVAVSASGASIQQGGCHADVSSGETGGTLCSGIERKAS